MSPGIETRRSSRLAVRRLGVGWLVRAGLLLALLLGPSVAVDASQPPLVEHPAVSTLEALPEARGEVDELERLARETGVVTSMPEPGVATWLQDFFQAFGRGLAGLLSTHLGAASEVAGVLVRWFLGLLLLVLFGFAALLFWRWYRAGNAPGAAESATLEAAEALPIPEGVDRGELLRQRLAEGDGAGAAEALWWWLADALDAPAEPSWTSRELIHRAGRRDLRPLVRRLDGLLYALGTPAVAEVEGLWHALEERVA